MKIGVHWTSRAHGWLLMVGVAMLVLTSTALANRTPDPAIMPGPALQAETDAGMLFGRTSCPDGSCGDFVKIDPLTGEQTLVMTLEDHSDYTAGYGIDAYTFDTSGERMFLLRYHFPRTTPITTALTPLTGSPASPVSTRAITGTEPGYTTHLMTINTTTGIFTETGPITAMVFLGFDPRADQLFGITACDSALCNAFVHIDQTTGAATPVGDLHTSDSHSYGIAQAMDPDGQRFFLQQYRGLDAHLLTIDTQTGAFTATQPISNLLHFAYDRSTDSVVGIGECPSGPPVCRGVIRIDTMTGESTLLNTYDLAPSFNWADAADVATHRLFLQRYEAGTPNPFLMTVDTTTGAFTSTAQPLSRSLSLLGYSPVALPATLKNVADLRQRVYLPHISR